MISAVIFSLLQNSWTSVPLDNGRILSHRTEWVQVDLRGVTVRRIKAETVAAKPAKIGSLGYVLCSTSECGLYAVDRSGVRMWSVPPLPGVNDPAPILCNQDFVVYGTGNYIWPAVLDDSDYYDQSVLRRVQVRNARTGRLMWAKSYFEVGLPVAIIGRLLVTLAPHDMYEWYYAKPGRATFDANVVDLNSSSRRLTKTIVTGLNGRRALSVLFRGPDSGTFNDNKVLVPRNLVSYQLLIAVLEKPQVIDVLIDGRRAASFWKGKPTRQIGSSTRFPKSNKPANTPL